MTGYRARLRGTLLAAAFATVGQSALADTPAICPRNGDGSVNTTVEVSRDDLAGQALSDAGVSLLFVKRATAPGTLAATPPSGVTPWQQLVFLGKAVCADKSLKLQPGQVGKDGTVSCTDDELSAVNDAAFKLLNEFEPPFRPTVAKMQVDAFFKHPEWKVYCTADAPGAAKTDSASKAGDGKGAGATTEKLLDWTNFRVRGASSDLAFGSNSEGYDAADKAKLSVGKDSGKAATSLVVAVGYLVPLSPKQKADDPNYTSFSLLPFAALDLENSKKDGEDRDTKSNQFSVGASLIGDRTISPLDLLVAATPKAVFNHHDHSQVAGLNILAQPTFWYLNRVHVIGDSSLGFAFLGDLRINAGTFMKEGTRTADDARDFLRGGGRAGLLFETVKDFKVPIDLTLTDTWMQAAAGHPGHLSELKTDLSVYFDKDKHFGIDLGYSKGRVEDLDDRDHKWTLAFSAKY